MLRLLKRIAWVGMLAAGLPSAQAFSTGGPIGKGGDGWQVPDLGYGILVWGDIMAPKNIGEDYRRNTPIMYYAFDENFLDFYGSNGVWAVDQAYAILNNLTNVSSYSADLSEIPLEAARVNYAAGALYLLDLKSVTLGIMVEELGLADPIRYTWDLHDRFVEPGAACPLGIDYLVTKRNFAIMPSDLETLQYSSYVNGELYSYAIHDYCGTPHDGLPLSEAVEISPDVPINAARFIPVASAQLNMLALGGFYTGLTRDDVAGLRYLMRSGHVHWEDNPANSVVLVTNNTPSLLVTLSLALLEAQSLTNDDAALVALYPGLVIVPGSTTTSYTNVVTTTLSIYYTNSPYAPPGSPPQGVILTNYTTNVVQVYARQFANIVIWTNSLVSYVTVTDTNLTFPPYPSPGHPHTNTTTTIVLTNIPGGAFYILPAAANCGISILSNQLSAPIGITNTVVVYTPTNTIDVTSVALLVTSNLTLLTAQSLTNDDAALEALYPGLVIVPNSMIPFPTNVVTTNLFIYYTNSPYAPPGSPPQGMILTNYTTNVMINYTREFANVVVWSNSPVSYVTITDTNLTFPPYPTPGYAQAHTTTTTMLTNIPAADYYILPVTATNCGAYILSNVLSRAIGVTNTVVVDTPTNAIETTNLAFLVTSNLALLTAQSLTNNDAALEALYPGLVIVANSMIPSLTNVVTTNFSIYYTNYVWDPVGTLPRQVFATNYTTNTMYVYAREFANVVIWSNSPVSYLTVIDTNLYFSPFDPVGSLPQTNTTTTTVLTNIPAADYYILPATATNCGAYILSNVLSTAVGVTNTLLVPNAPANEPSGTYLVSRSYINWYTNHTLAYFPVECVTNELTRTYINWYTNHELAYFPVECVTNVLTRTYLSWFTNYTLVYFPVQCVASEPGLRRGIEKITFVKTAYDSLLGKFYAPQTNYFTMTTVTNSTNWVQTFRRVVTTPDFLFSARDMVAGPAALPTYFDVERNVNFNQGNILAGLAGPGTIDPRTIIIFDKVGPILFNSAASGQRFLDEKHAMSYAMWASYDDSTNAPVLYPNGTSIASLESQMLMQVTSISLPPGHVGVAYTTQLTGTGGVLPYTWSLAPDSLMNTNAPPSWLGPTPVPSNGRLSGTPDATGISSFFVQMTGADGGFTVWQVALTVLP